MITCRRMKFWWYLSRYLKYTCSKSFLRKKETQKLIWISQLIRTIKRTFRTRTPSLLLCIQAGQQTNLREQCSLMETYCAAIHIMTSWGTRLMRTITIFHMYLYHTFKNSYCSLLQLYLALKLGLWLTLNPKKRSKTCENLWSKICKPLNQPFLAVSLCSTTGLRKQ